MAALFAQATSPSPRELMTAAREEAGQRWQAMRPIFEQMNEAREAGDNERVAAMRQQLEPSAT